MLIFKNGYIEWGSSSAKSLFDDDGNPIKQRKFDRKADCYVETATETKQGTYEDGKFTQYSFQISVNSDADIINHPPRNIALHHKYKGDLGVFVVQRLEVYELTNTIVIWV